MIYLINLEGIPTAQPEEGDYLTFFNSQGKSRRVNWSDINFGNNNGSTEIDANSVTGLTSFIQSTSLTSNQISDLISTIQNTDISTSKIPNLLSFIQSAALSTNQVSGLVSLIQSTSIPASNVTGLVNIVQSTPITWNTKNSNFTATANSNYLINNTSSSITVTLPSSPNVGDTVRALLFSNANPVIFNRNGSKYIRLDLDIRSQVPFSLIELVYCDSTRGWIHTLPSSQTLNGSVHNWVSNGDTNGVFYYLGTNYGTGNWANPSGTARLTVSTPNSGVSGLNLATDRDTHTLVDIPDSGNRARVVFDLVNRRLLLNRYTIYRGSGLAGNASSWDIEGSNDNSNWSNLHTVTNATNITGYYNYTVTSSEVFRYIRFSMANNGNPEANNRLRLFELELYGTLVII